MPPGSLIVGVDLAPIKPIPRCTTFQSDITSDKCRATIRHHLKTWKADTVLHDGAPNVGTAWVQDAFSQAELVLQSLRLATDFLIPGGTFITKIFRSKDYNSLLWVFNQLFGKVEATKPPSSRNVSAEIFVVCREYKAPKHLDPKFLDPKTVFAELADPAPNNEAKVFNPEKKKRKREGYAEGDWTQFKTMPVSEFIQTIDPIAVLGSYNKLHFDQPPNGDVALAAIDKMPETTSEIRNCCADLKVLGRKDFKILLRWRLKVRDMFGMASKKRTAEAQAGEEVAEVEPMDEEMQLQEDLQKAKDQADSSKKRGRRRDNERKRKEIVRMQMNMTTPMEIGMEQAGPYGEDSMFNLRPVDRAGVTGKVASGRMHTIQPKPDSESEDSDADSTDDEGDNLEGQLDSLYEQYQERRKEVDAKYRAKKARKEHNDDFEGFSGEDEGDKSEEEIREDLVSEEDSSSDDEDNLGQQPLSRTVAAESEKQGPLSRRAAMFFDQDIFREIGALDTSTHDDSGIDMEDSDEPPPVIKKPSSTAPLPPRSKSKSSTAATDSNAPRPFQTDPTTADQADSDSDAGFEVVKTPHKDDWTTPSQKPDPTTTRAEIDIITAEAMTLAHTLATGGPAARAALLDDNYNKYTLRDTDGLPAWFLDDEGSHSKPHRPITAAAAAAIKEKLRALNARPIKKVREAKARKKLRAAHRVEKLKRKSALIADEEVDAGMNERDKARRIEGIMAKAGKKRPKKEVKVVVARGGNRGVSGRPKGTKGKYKMVDARLKKDVRVLRRAAKRNK